MSPGRAMKKMCFMYLLLLYYPGCYAADTILTINSAVFEVELAVTPDERKTGLMQRNNLAANQGMLFIYPEPRIISFWMKQTLIPLDILYFDSNGQLLEVYESVFPCSIPPCKRYTNRNPAQFVLEVKAGTIQQLNIMIGDSFEIQRKN